MEPAEGAGGDELARLHAARVPERVDERDGRQDRVARDMPPVFCTTMCPFTLSVASGPERS